jgi:hypothetical protein
MTGRGTGAGEPDDEPDFADEHTSMTFEEEQTDQPAVSGDESAKRGAVDQEEEPKGPL